MSHASIASEITGRSATAATAHSINESSAALIRRWMVASALCVVLTLVIGGVTRLTESGLSITEWKPVTGVLPPWSAASWNTAFERYLQIPEAQTVHRGITLHQFQVLFWWEWAHRMVARVAGLVIAVPFLMLLAAGRIPRALRARLVALPVLTGAQGALGWYMVSSGLSLRTDVSQYRLVAHLGLALCIYVIAVWTALMVGVRHRRDGGPPWHRGAAAVAVLAFVTVLSGGFVAGLDAGRIFNTFPLMGSRLIPPGYLQLAPVWRNLFENAAAAQFNHRLLATITLLTVVAVTAWQRRERGDLSPPFGLMAATVALQVSLGIATLLLHVPVAIAALHQLGAVALLTAALWATARGHSAQSSA